LAVLDGPSMRAVIVDLSVVSYIDASGVATLIEGLKIAHSRPTTLCLKGLQGRVLQLFEVTGLLSLFDTSGCKGSSAELKVSGWQQFSKTSERKRSSISTTSEA